MFARTNPIKDDWPLLKILPWWEKNGPFTVFYVLTAQTNKLSLILHCLLLGTSNLWVEVWVLDELQWING